MDILLRTLTRHGFRRGLNGSRAWLLTGIVVAGIRAFQHLGQSDREVLYRTEVQPGDRFEIKTRQPGKR